MESELREYGLLEKEIKVYLASLKLGSSTANELSFKTDIRRSTVYEVLESLRKKGLMTSFQKDKKSFFEAVQPKVLIDLLKEKEKLIENILPDLNKLSNLIPSKSSVVLFEGGIGIKNAVGEMLDSDEIFVYGASRGSEKIFETFPANFSQKRVENKIMMRAIIEKNPPSHMLEKNVQKFTKIKYLNILKEHKAVYFIYSDILLIVVLGEDLSAIKIQSPLIVESQKILFEQLWKIAKS